MRKAKARNGDVFYLLLSEFMKPCGNVHMKCIFMAYTMESLKLYNS